MYDYNKRSLIECVVLSRSPLALSHSLSRLLGVLCADVAQLKLSEGILQI